MTDRDQAIAVVLGLLSRHWDAPPQFWLSAGISGRLFGRWTASLDGVYYGEVTHFTLDIDVDEAERWLHERARNHLARLNRDLISHTLTGRTL